MMKYLEMNLLLLFTCLLFHVSVAKESCTSTGVFCVTDCSGLDDGDYQACDTCRSYVSCSGGAAVLTRPCPHWGSSESSDDDDSSSEKYLVWDDDYKRCDWKSTTCTCKDDDKKGSIDGDWSEYSSWSACVVPCNGGFQFKKRKCDSPKPSRGGSFCVGSDIQLRECNTQPCER